MRLSPLVVKWDKTLVCERQVYDKDLIMIYVSFF